MDQPVNSLPQSFYGLLEILEERPLMILGERSLDALWVFLLGYRYARAQQGMPLTDEEQEFEEFGHWVHEVYRDSSTQSWAKVIQHNHRDKREAWDRLFSLLCDYRKKNRYPSKANVDSTNVPALSTGKAQ